MLSAVSCRHLDLRAMPSLAWNIAMCFMMGARPGGMLPVTYALLPR